MVRTPHKKRTMWAYNRAEPKQLNHQEQNKYNVEKAKRNLGRARRQEMVFASTSGMTRNWRD